MLWQQREQMLAEDYENLKNDLFTAVDVNSFGALQE